MPTIAIDAESANKQKRTGVEWYAYHLIQALKEQTFEPDDRVWLYSPTPLQGELEIMPPNWESRTLWWPLSSGWMQGRVSFEILRRPSDVLFVPSQGLPRFLPRATVTMIHDVGFRRRPELYEPATRKRLEHVTHRALKHATKILVPSEFTKSELIALYNVSSDKLVVIPHAPDHARYKPLQESEVLPVLQKYRLSRKLYFLAIGRIEAKKNIATLIRAFEMFKQSRGVGDPFELVLVGSPGFGFENIKQYYERSSAKSAIRNLGWIDEADLPALMNGAHAYLFPSWYEGFGIPNLEAMACGVPLITSNIPAHKEVVQDAALFVPPNEPEAWASAMRRISEEGTLVDELVRKGLERAKQFSWEKTAEETWRVLRGLV